MSLLTGFPLFKKKSVKPLQIISENWMDRELILNPDVNLFSWKRTIVKSVSEYLELIISANTNPIVFTTSIDDLSKDLSRERKNWDPGFLYLADEFWKDVYCLVKDFLHFSEVGIGTVHLKIIDNNACTKFHTDRYALRLFTTYYGTGTEWLPEKACNRKALGKSNNNIIKDHSLIQKMNPFEVGILKGEFENKSGKVRGIVHRSPQIEEKGEKRIIMRVDI